MTTFFSEFLRQYHQKKLVNSGIGISKLAHRVLVFALLACFSCGQFGAAGAIQPSDPEPRGRNLRMVEIGARAFNCLFDTDCVITANDQTSAISFPGGRGRGFLQTRLIPRGARGTAGAGMFAYLYRIDLRNIQATRQLECIDKFTVPFSNLVALNTGNGQRPEVFIISRGGIGSVKPVRAIRTSNSVEFTFRGLCTGGGPNQITGLSSFFIALVANSPARGAVASLRTQSTGRLLNLNVRTASSDAAPSIVDNNNNRATSGAERVIRDAQGNSPGAVINREVAPRVRDLLPGVRRPNRPAILSTPTPRPTTPPKGDITLDFERVNGPPGGPEEFQAGVRLSNQYRDAAGIRFGAGTSVHLCNASSEFGVCTYPRAASGRHTALFDGISNRGRLIMNFDRPVKMISMQINPTGAKDGEKFNLEFRGFNVNGSLEAVGNNAFAWSNNTAFTWPNRATIIAREGQGFTRINAVLLGTDRRNRPTRFLFDNLIIEYFDTPEDDPNDVTAPTVGTLILNGQTANTDLGEAEAVAWPEPPKPANGRRATKPLFKPAPRLRAPIDWAAAEKALTDQSALGLAPAPLRSQQPLNAAALPVLLPDLSDEPVDLAVTRDGNSYSAAFRAEGRNYEYYGTRMITVLNPGKTGGNTNTNTIRYTENQTSFAASFSAFGATYRLIRYCKFDSPKRDPSCYDRESMKTRIAQLRIALGIKAGERP